MKSVHTTPRKRFLLVLLLFTLLSVGPAHPSLGQETTTLYYSGFEKGHPPFVYGAAAGADAPSRVIGYSRSGSYAGGIKSTAQGYEGTVFTEEAFTFEQGIEYTVEVYIKVPAGSGTLTLYTTSGTSQDDVIFGGQAWGSENFSESDHGEYTSPTSFLFRGDGAEPRHLAFMLESDQAGSMYIDDISVKATCVFNAGYILPLVPPKGCQGPAPAGTLTLDGADNPVLKWQSSTDHGKTWTDIANTSSTHNYPALSQTTSYRAVSSNGGSCLGYSSVSVVEVNDGVVQVTVEPSATNICQGNPVTFTATTYNAGTNPKFQWKVNGIKAPDGKYATFTKSDLRNNDKITVVVTSKDACNKNATKTSDEISITVNDPGTATTWVGNTADWFDPANWTACVPNELTNALVPPVGSGKMVPTISPHPAGPAKVKGLEVNSLVVVDEGGQLEISGEFAGTGSFEAQPASTITFSGIGIGPGVYGELVLKGSDETKVLTGPVSVQNTLRLNNHKLLLGDHTLTLASPGVLSGYSSANYILQEGEGYLQIMAIGDNEGAFFPVGTSTTSYSPAVITNAGTEDAFSVRVVSGFRTEGLGGDPIQQQVVQKTWEILEGEPGGSDATLTLQWARADQTADFNPLEVSLSKYTSSGWSRISPEPEAAEALGNNSFSVSHSGIRSLGLFGVTSGESMPLPVSLAYFKAEKRGADALLTWETVSEQNNQGFGVEVSADGERFREIGFVKSKSAHSQSRLNYSFRDSESGKSGTRYYRLRQTDLDGTIAYSALQAVTFGPVAGPVVRAFPNPFDQAVELEIASDKQQTARLLVRNALGRVVHTQELALRPGLTRHQLLLGDRHSAGLYSLSLYLGDRVYHTKLIRK
jgi:hypothetical protein